MRRDLALAPPRLCKLPPAVTQSANLRVARFVSSTARCRRGRKRKTGKGRADNADYHARNVARCCAHVGQPHEEFPAISEIIPKPAQKSYRGPQPTERPRWVPRAASMTAHLARCAVPCRVRVICHRAESRACRHLPTADRSGNPKSRAYLSCPPATIEHHITQHFASRDQTHGREWLNRAKSHTSHKITFQWNTTSMSSR